MREFLVTGFSRFYSRNSQNREGLGGIRTTGFFAVVAPLSLAACGQPTPVLILPPASLTTCAPEPPAPALPAQDQQAERDRLILEYLLSLRAAGGDCRAKVNGLATWVKAQ